VPRRVGRAGWIARPDRDTHLSTDYHAAPCKDPKGGKLDLHLDGKRARVTGGTRSIGRAVVEAPADEGCRVSFCARTADAVQTAEMELRQRGRTAFGTRVDVTDDTAVAYWTEACAARMGGIDIVNR